MTLPHSKDIFKYPARFQFGQAGAPCGGSSCCTDTCIQMILEYYEDRTLSLKQIRAYAQTGTSFNEASCTGINHVEVLNALNRLGVSHYKVAYGVDHIFVANKLQIGPTLVGVHYGSYPNKKTHCASKAVRSAEVGGKTDCSFRGAHAILAIGRRSHNDSAGRHLHTDIYTRDPDHNSPSRPERPPYDRIRLSDLWLAMENLPKYTAFNKTYVIYPTKRK